MLLRYRNYTHAANENLVGISSEAMLNQQGAQHARRTQIQIQGKLIGSGISDLASKCAALRTAYAGNASGDLVFRHSDGTIFHQFLDRNTVGGVRVIRGPDFPEDIRAYVGYVPYSITLEAVIPDTGVHLMAWDEVVTFEGGGPDFDHLVPVEGLPQKQMLHRNTPFMATQSGQATGHFRYPFVPGPIWPADLKKAPRIIRASPRRQGGALIEYRIEWEYEFQSSTPLVGVPRPPTLK